MRLAAASTATASTAAAAAASSPASASASSSSSIGMLPSGAGLLDHILPRPQVAPQRGLGLQEAEQLARVRELAREQLVLRELHAQADELARRERARARAYRLQLLDECTEVLLGCRRGSRRGGTYIVYQ